LGRSPSKVPNPLAAIRLHPLPRLFKVFSYVIAACFKDLDNARILRSPQARTAVRRSSSHGRMHACQRVPNRENAWRLTHLGPNRRQRREAMRVTSAGHSSAAACMGKPQRGEGANRRARRGPGTVTLC
jgi:hypothetical protein